MGPLVLLSDWVLLSFFLVLVSDEGQKHDADISSLVYANEDNVVLSASWDGRLRVHEQSDNPSVLTMLREGRPQTRFLLSDWIFSRLLFDWVLFLSRLLFDWVLSRLLFDWIFYNVFFSIGLFIMSFFRLGLL